MVAITFDMDWAPDWAIEDIIGYLVPRKVKATFFVTNETPALATLRCHPELFELGLHPNMFPGSSHGSSCQEVFEYCRKIVPEAVSMRTHGLYQSSNFLIQVNQQFGIKNDVSLFLPNLEVLKPFTFQVAACRLKRIPYNWEDDFSFHDPDFSWSTKTVDWDQDHIFNFHPIHTALNSRNASAYAELRAKYVNISGCSKAEIMNFDQAEAGTGTFFREIADHLAETGKSHTIRELCEEAE